MFDLSRLRNRLAPPPATAPRPRPTVRLAAVTLCGALLAAWAIGPGPVGQAASKGGATEAEPKSEGKRLAVPDEQAQAKVLKVIKELYKADYAKRKPQEMLELAAKLTQEAADTKDDPAARFVLLREASELAARAGDATVTLQTVDELAREFDIDVLALKAERLAAVIPAATPTANLAAAEACLTLLDEALAADDYEQALRLVSLATDAARKARSTALTSRAEARSKEVQAFQKEFETVKAARAKLREKPDDPDASLAVGKYLCLAKGDWKKGLPLLAQGGDAALRAAAQQELDSPADAEAQAKLGDGWWDAAGKATGRAKTQMQVRAIYWYEQAAPELKGLVKARVDKRLQEATALALPRTVLTPGGLTGRSGPAREQLLREGGGTKESEAAVAAGLRWLVQHQAPNGHWSLEGFHLHARCNCAGFGRKNDTAGTALALLPLLGAGETHRKGTYSRNVQRGLNYLLGRQKRDGDFGDGMYAQGLATIALCEAYALTADGVLKAPAQRAVTFIVRAQHDAGGWRYGPRQPGDTSVTGWQVLALKTAQMAGLTVPKETFTDASRFLDSVSLAEGSAYGYLGPQFSPTTVTLTAVGLLCREHLGVSPRDPGLLRGVERLKETPPKETTKNSYYYYYATQVLHHLGGDSWEFWNPKMRDLLIETQDKGTDSRHPHQKGSWSPVGDMYGNDGGRLMTTSFALLTLEVYYRHVPLYGRGKDGGREKKEP
jgi:hypothetical protein